MKTLFDTISKRFPPKHCDIQLGKLIRNVLHNGEWKKTRNGKTISMNAVRMEFDLQNEYQQYTPPVVTTKFLPWKTCLKELLWFIQGSTDNTVLNQQNVKIWNPNASKEFMRSRNLNYEDEGDLGPIYGHQWRHFNAPYDGCKKNYTGQGVDQLQNIIDALKTKCPENLRRLVMSAWNPCQLDEMALPPCHVLTQFVINNEDKLSCILYQRSGDIGLGVPFNMASYGFLTCLLAKHTGLQPGNFYHFIGDAHIYEKHIPFLEEQIQRIPHSPPNLEILTKQENINDYCINDFKLIDYTHHQPLKMEMIA